MPRLATFDIPTTSPATVVWTLNIWPKGNLIGSDTGTSGVLTVSIPRTIHGNLQADVRRDGKWHSGARMSLSGGSGGGRKHGHGGGNSGGNGPGGTGGGPGTGGTARNSGGSGSDGGTTTPPATAAGGGSAAGTGSTGAGPTFAGTTGQHDTVDPITLVAGAKAPATASELAFSGAGSAFWTAAVRNPRPFDF